MQGIIATYFRNCNTVCYTGSDGKRRQLPLRTPGEGCNARPMWQREDRKVIWAVSRIVAAKENISNKSVRVEIK